MKHIPLCLALSLLILPTFWCQSQIEDTVKVLDAVVIKAFAHDKPLQDVPASIAKISSADLERFNNTSILPAMNAQPGVRMEERSPGSYRLSIRGSTLRSPFGVRNVKVYWNGLPLTDHGGNTYLNLLDFSAIDNIEVIKGPGSSLYGAGTGGVLLLGRNQIGKQRFSADVLARSYGLLRYRGGVEKSFSKFNIGVDYAHQSSDGYREQSEMARDMFSLRSNVLVGKKNSLSFNFLYSDLFYQTPGGLTRIQYDTMPSMARPNAAARKAAIYNKTFFGGISLESELGQHWTNTVSLFGNSTSFENPAILNYEKRDERGGGLRTEFQWSNENRKLTLGGEFQTGRSLISVGANNQGTFVDNGNNVRLPSDIFFAFAQHDWDLPVGFFLTVGFSINKLMLEFDDYTTSNKRNLGPIVSPRVALSKKIIPKLSAYVSYSGGYSPPTAAEVFPSLAIYNPNLKPEQGNNFEIGIKSDWKWIRPSLTLYSFQLNQTIIRLDSAGSDYFTNAGRTSQYGIEAFIQVNPTVKKGVSGWLSYTGNHFRFKDYFQDANNFSGNSLTGSPPNVVAAGVDFKWDSFYSNLTANYVDHIPLNDANTVYASEYFLFGLRMGYSFGKEKQVEVFTGADNLLDRKYSLGNDLNAFGGRYFNAAPRRNFYGGLKVRI
jgi:iron complex outermembrane recepter protein